ncbi:MAG TPA: hypothetical protein VN666_12340, partial [Nitrospira sp.]|nr:hypothetical protein [Nitrospira sp.]
AESRTNRTASSLNSSVDRRRVLVIILSSDFIILLLLEVSVKSGEGQAHINRSTGRPSATTAMGKTVQAIGWDPVQSPAAIEAAWTWIFIGLLRRASA